MKRMICAAIAVAAVPCAYAQSGTGSSYVSLTAGVTGDSEYDYDFPGGNVEADTKSGVSLSAAYGVYFSENLRGELGLSWSKAEIDIVRRFGGPQILIYEEPGDVQSYMVDANVYWDFATTGAFRPYVGAGLGLGMIDVDDRVITDSAFGWTWRAMAGVSVPMNDTSSLFVEGRYEAISREIGDGLGFTDADDRLSGDSVGLYAGVRFGM